MSSTTRTPSPLESLSPPASPSWVSDESCVLKVTVTNPSEAESQNCNSPPLTSRAPAVAPYKDFVDCDKCDVEHLFTSQNKALARSESEFPFDARDGSGSPHHRRGTSSTKLQDQFPMKLYRMLSVVEDLGLSHIVSWKPHGRAFEVKDVDQFVKNVMPRFFKQSKITSFQRQLNLYGFQRFLYGPDVGSSYHQYFLRGKPFLCMAMYRTKVKGASRRSRRKASERRGKEPDFYAMKYLPQLDPTCRERHFREFFARQESPNENAYDNKRKMVHPHGWCPVKRQSPPPLQFHVPFQPQIGQNVYNSSAPIYPSSGCDATVPIQGFHQEPNRSGTGTGSMMRPPEFWDYANSFPYQLTSNQSYPSQPDQFQRPPFPLDFGSQNTDLRPMHIAAEFGSKPSSAMSTETPMPTSLVDLKNQDLSEDSDSSLDLHEDLKDFFVSLMKDVQAYEEAI